MMSIIIEGSIQTSDNISLSDTQFIIDVKDHLQSSSLDDINWFKLILSDVNDDEQTTDPTDQKPSNTNDGINYKDELENLKQLHADILKMLDKLASSEQATSIKTFLKDVGYNMISKSPFDRFKK